MAGLLQCVVTRRADEPIHLSREMEREEERKARREETVSMVNEEAGEGKPTRGPADTFSVWSSIMLLLGPP